MLNLMTAANKLVLFHQNPFIFVYILLLNLLPSYNTSGYFSSGTNRASICISRLRTMYLFSPQLILLTAEPTIRCLGIECCPGINRLRKQSPIFGIFFHE